MFFISLTKQRNWKTITTMDEDGRKKRPVKGDSAQIIQAEVNPTSTVDSSEEPVLLKPTEGRNEFSQSMAVDGISRNGGIAIDRLNTIKSNEGENSKDTEDIPFPNDGDKMARDTCNESAFPGDEDRMNQEADETDGLIVKGVCQNIKRQLSLSNKIAPNGQLTTNESTRDKTDSVGTQARNGQDSRAEYDHEPASATVDKRKEAKLLINGSIAFCEIVTVTYGLRGSRTKQHYIKSTEGHVDGDIGLERLDELVVVNGTELKDLPLKRVKQIFKNIRLENQELHLNLTVRRWKRTQDSTDEDPVWAEVWEIEFKLVLVTEEKLTRRNLARHTYSAILRKHERHLKRRLSVKTLSENVRRKEDLSKGNICVQSVDQPYACHVQVGDDSQFLHSSSDGLLSCGVLGSEHSNTSIFTVEPFIGQDQGPQPITLTVFCLRLREDTNNSHRFLWYDTCDLDASCVLHGDDKIGTENIDERCFIKRSFGNQLLLQSAVNRDLFLFYDGQNFKMKYVDADKLEPTHEGPWDLPDFYGCWMQIDPVREMSESKGHNSGFGSLLCGLGRSFRRSTGRRRNRPI